MMALRVSDGPAGNMLREPTMILGRRIQTAKRCLQASSNPALDVASKSRAAISGGAVFGCLDGIGRRLLGCAGCAIQHAGRKHTDKHDCRPQRRATHKPAQGQACGLACGRCWNGLNGLEHGSARERLSVVRFHGGHGSQISPEIRTAHSLVNHVSHKMGSETVAAFANRVWRLCFSKRPSQQIAMP